MKILRLLPRAHQKIFIHFGVLQSNFSPLFFGEVRQVARVHLHGFFYGRVLFEVLRWDIKYFGYLFMRLVFVVGTVGSLSSHLGLAVYSGATSFDLVRLLGPWH